MLSSKQISKEFRDIFLNNDWAVGTSYKTPLSDVHWKEAIVEAGSHNTIAALVFHINYYLSGILNVLKGGKLEIHDKYSFDMPAIECKEDWRRMLQSL